MQKSKKQENQDRRDQDLYGGLIRMHILHPASKEPVFGLWKLNTGKNGVKISGLMDAVLRTQIAHLDQTV